MRYMIIFLFYFILIPRVHADEYRDLVLRIRSQAAFKLAVPFEDVTASYQFKWGKPLYESPSQVDLYPYPKNSSFIRLFWDRILLEDGSYVRIQGEVLPLTCIFVEGLDERASGKNTPLLPDFLLRVYLIANDFSCQGPINPAWPSNGGKRETWSNYLYYEIRDPTIMLPTEAKIRYQWQEFSAVLYEK